MRYKPFLSHKRQRAKAVGYLKEQLCARGAGGWKDTDDLPRGGASKKNIVRAIERDTGGFIYWATKDTLTSDIICKTELPAALDRAKQDPTYSLLPVFVELQPSDGPAIAAAIGPDYAERLLEHNGIVRRPKQPLHEVARETAREYVKLLVRNVPSGPVSVAITAFRAPTEQHDLTLDWRALFDAESRTLRTGAIETFIEALGDIREALQSRSRVPRAHVEIALPMPLAMLVGYEWRYVTQLCVTLRTVQPGTGEMLVVEPGGPSSTEWPEPRVEALPGAGPSVLAVSVGSTLGKTVDRYAAEHDARKLEHLHIDRDPVADPLDANDVRGLAAKVVKRLNELQADGSPKHLLLRTPASLAAAIGLAANGTGPTWVPFYDGHDYYVGGLWIG